MKYFLKTLNESLKFQGENSNNQNILYRDILKCINALI